jgi:diguanylate cyclase (GGDEF)-like protein
MDVSDRERRDVLTGLLNRRAFLSDSAPVRARGTHVAYIGLDHVRDLNAMLGNDAGDTALQVLGSRLGALPTDAGVTYRMGGDVFAFVTLGSHEAVIATVRHLLEQIRLPIPALDGRCVTATAGVVEMLPGEDWLSGYQRSHDCYVVERREGDNRFNDS